MEILSILLWTPAIGALLLAFVPAQNTQLIRWIANSFGALAFLLSCFVIAVYDQGNAGLQFNESFVLNPKLGSAYALGVDGLSAPLIVLATLLTSVALLASFSLSNRIKGYHICILLLEFGMLGVFMSQDWLIFFIFWEVTLTPLFFLIDRWGR